MTKIKLSYFSLILFLSFFLSFINAMEISLGARAGFSLSSYIGKDAGDVEDAGLNTKPRSNFIGGLVFNMDFKDFFGLNFNWIYSAKGRTSEGYWTIVSGEPDANIYHIDKLNYIEFQVLPIFTLSLPKKVKPYIGVGFFNGLLLSAKTTIDIRVPPELVNLGYNSSKETTDIKENSNTNDLGLCISSGVKVITNSGIIFFDGRFSLSAFAIDKNEGTGKSYKEINNMQFSFNLGYVFFLKRKMDKEM